MLLLRPIAAHSIAAWFVNFFGVEMFFCILQLAGRLLLGVLQSGAVYLSVVDSCLSCFFLTAACLDVVDSCLSTSTCQQLGASSPPSATIRSVAPVNGCVHASHRQWLACLSNCMLVCDHCKGYVEQKSVAVYAISNCMVSPIPFVDLGVSLHGCK